MTCFAGKSKTGHPAAFEIKKHVVARGKVAGDGTFTARFIVAQLLIRGTIIEFFVDGKHVAGVRV